MASNIKKRPLADDLANDEPDPTMLAKHIKLEEPDKEDCRERIALIEEIDKLTERLDSAKHERDDLAATLDDKQQELAKIHEKLNEVKARQKTLFAERKKLKTNIAKLKETSSKTKASLKELQELAKMRATDMKKKDKDVTSLKAQLKQAQQQSAETAELQEENVGLKALVETLVDADAKLAGKEERIKQLEEELATAHIASQCELDEKERAIADLKDKLESAHGTIRNQASQLTQETSCNEQLQQHVSNDRSSRASNENTGQIGVTLNEQAMNVDGLRQSMQQELGNLKAHMEAMKKMLGL